MGARRALRDVRKKGSWWAEKDRVNPVNGSDECFAARLFVRQTQGTTIRVFPALNITTDEMEEGLSIMEAAIGRMAESVGHGYPGPKGL